MESSAVSQGIELIVRGLEILGVAVIGIAFPYGTIRGLVQISQRRPDAFLQLKNFIGKALQLGLEFLVAADIVKTVTVNLTRDGIVSLGLLILVRTFLSWSITVEIEGCLPWQVARSGGDLRHARFARLDGPLHFRLIFQPLMAIFRSH